MAEVKITKDMRIKEIITVKPATIPVFGSLGMGCIHCLAADSETLEQAAAVHGLDIDALVNELNKA